MPAWEGELRRGRKLLSRVPLHLQLLQPLTFWPEEHVGPLSYTSLGLALRLVLAARLPVGFFQLPPCRHGQVQQVLQRRQIVRLSQVHPEGGPHSES